MYYIFGVAILLCVSFSAGSCPDGWTHHINRCYHFSHDAEAMPTAAIVCQKMGGTIAEIDDIYENNYLTSQARLYRQNFWIGLHDMIEQGHWIWYESNRSLNTTGVSDWGQGQPDNRKGQEQCVYIDGNGNWADGVCHSIQKFICERSDTTTDIVG